MYIYIYGTHMYMLHVVTWHLYIPILVTGIFQQYWGHNHGVQQHTNHDADMTNNLGDITDMYVIWVYWVNIGYPQFFGKDTLW